MARMAKMAKFVLERCAYVVIKSHSNNKWWDKPIYWIHREHTDNLRDFHWIYEEILAGLLSMCGLQCWNTEMGKVSCAFKEGKLQGQGWKWGFLLVELKFDGRLIEFEWII